MDLLSSIRKSGSRGGVNFSWDDVSTSQHRENYLGHSLMAPVGRWQKGRDLSWYAKGDDKNAVAGETADEKKARERKEEIRRIKEAEEDALARALGLPVADRGITGSNSITVGEVKRVVQEERIGEDADGDDESSGLGKGKGFGDFVGKVQGDAEDSGFVMGWEGGLVGRGGKKEVKREERSRSRERKPRRHRHRSRSGERRRHRSRSDEGRRHRRRYDDREERGPRSRSVERREKRYRSRSPDGYRGRAEREERGERRPERLRRSRSPAERDSRRDRIRDRR